MNSNEGVDHWSDNQKFFEDGCPFCKSKDFLEGPHGGLSINFKCANKECGATFNDMWHFGIDLLSQPETNKADTADGTMECDHEGARFVNPRGLVCPKCNQYLPPRR